MKYSIWLIILLLLFGCTSKNEKVLHEKVLADLEVPDGFEFSYTEKVYNERFFSHELYFPLGTDKNDILNNLKHFAHQIYSKRPKGIDCSGYIKNGFLSFRVAELSVNCFNGDDSVDSRLRHPDIYTEPLMNIGDKGVLVGTQPIGISYTADAWTDSHIIRRLTPGLEVKIDNAKHWDLGRNAPKSERHLIRYKILFDIDGKTFSGWIFSEDIKPAT